MPPDFRKLPKIELHCHLDASVRIATVAELGRQIGLTLPEPLAPALVAPEICLDLADFLLRIDLALEVMQHRDQLVRIAREFVEDLALDGVNLRRGALRAAAALAAGTLAARSRRCGT